MHAQIYGLRLGEYLRSAWVGLTPPESPVTMSRLPDPVQDTADVVFLAHRSRTFAWWETLRETERLLIQAPKHIHVVVIGSPVIRHPCLSQGPGYHVEKAGLWALVQYWAALGRIINMVTPNGTLSTSGGTIDAFSFARSCVRIALSDTPMTGQHITLE